MIEIKISKQEEKFFKMTLDYFQECKEQYNSLLSQKEGALEEIKGKENEIKITEEYEDLLQNSNERVILVKNLLLSMIDMYDTPQKEELRKTIR